MLEPGTTVDPDGIAGRGGRLPAEIQSGEAAQPTGLREPGDFCGAARSIPSSGRASPSLRWGWTKKKHKSPLSRQGFNDNVFSPIKSAFFRCPVIFRFHFCNDSLRVFHRSLAVYHLMRSEE